MVVRSVIGGGLASVGMTALLSPVLLYVAAVASLLAFALRMIDATFSVTEAALVLVPWLAGALIASLVGGYVAGAIARGHRARNGGAAALLGLVLSLLFAMTLVSATLIGQLVAIAALLALPLAALGGRFGALLAPRTTAIEVAPRTTAIEARSPADRRAAPAQREPARVAQAVGRKGGEREDDVRR